MNRYPPVTRRTLIAGILQLSMALVVLGAPLFSTCAIDQGEMVCTRQSYIQMGGNLLGYAFLAAMIAIGVIAVVTRDWHQTRFLQVFRWVAAIVSFTFGVLGAWSIGALFLPGGVLMLFAALSSHHHADLAAQPHGAAHR